jgi:zinc finger protein
LQLVKSDSATVTVPELEFEIPKGTQKGTITTVEGMLREAGNALRALQPQRAQQDPETAAAISHFLGSLWKHPCVLPTEAWPSE